MVKCEYCGEEIEGLPFKCKYCGGLFCVRHHLPENHECPGLHKAKSLYVLEYEERVSEREPVKAALRPRQTLLLHPGEIRDLAIALAASYAALAYPWAMSLRGALAVLLAVTLAFLPHELAHKFLAQRLGYSARFTLSPMGLLLTLISALPFIPIKVIMPGYVAVVSYYADRRSMGIVALAGPLTNLLACALALLLPDPFIRHIVVYTNAIIALFNLIPIDGLDGVKVLRWSPLAWAAAIAASIALYAWLRFS